MIKGNENILEETMKLVFHFPQGGSVDGRTYLVLDSVSSKKQKEQNM